jgi:hypothetical protein
MPFVIFLFLFFFLMAGFFAFCFCAYLACLVYNFFARRKREKIIRLSSYRARLQAVLAEQLRQINEIDQISRYSGLDRDAAWSKKYDDTLKKLLSASDKLADAKTFVDMKELNAGQETLLYVVRTIHVVNYRMKEITPRENFDDLPIFQQEEVVAQSVHVHVSLANTDAISTTTDETETPMKDSEKASGEKVENSEQDAHEEPGSIIYLRRTEKRHE